MARTWSEDNPKASLMARKQAVIVKAALDAFLASGYAEASVNQIAANAGVSIKTLYRHFENKDDLFTAVMQAACGNEADQPTPAWFSMPPAEALPLAGEDYLRHILSYDQLALYRVVTRDADRFPALGRQYHEKVTSARDARFAGYLALWAKRSGWKIGNAVATSRTFAALLKAQLFEQTLLGLLKPAEVDIRAEALRASRAMLLLLDDGDA